ncbi:prefoldin, alpha subunit [Kwoniella heveanensis CBS 569]|nr:prefoldin, alpha subunit [Kwoniella heveanensis CBS 569]
MSHTQAQSAGPSISTSMSMPTATFAPVERSEAYITHLQGSLIPQLEMTRRGLLVTEHDISEYETLQSKLDELEKVDKPIETLSELGAGVFVETRIEDTKNITLDLGLDVHLDMTLPEAKAYVIKKLDFLKKKRDTLTEKEEHLVWQISMSQGAMTEQTQ